MGDLAVGTGVVTVELGVLRGDGVLKVKRGAVVGLLLNVGLGVVSSSAPTVAISLLAAAEANWDILSSFFALRHLLYHR